MSNFKVKKPETVTTEIWNSIHPDDREPIVLLAAKLLKYGYLHNDSFEYAIDIHEARKIIKVMDSRFDEVYISWIDLGIKFKGDDIEQSLLIGKLLKAIKNCSYEHSEEIINSTDNLRVAWSLTEWDFPKEYCVCCMSKIDEKLDYERKAGFSFHPECSEIFPKFAKNLSELVVSECNTHTMGEKVDDNWTENNEVENEDLPLYEEVETPKFLDLFGTSSELEPDNF